MLCMQLGAFASHNLLAGRTGCAGCLGHLRLLYRKGADLLRERPCCINLETDVLEDLSATCICNGHSVAAALM